MVAAHLRLLLSEDVHPNPSPTTKCPCPVCIRNVTSGVVSYLCNRCSGWVHSKFVLVGYIRSVLVFKNAAEYRRIKGLGFQLLRLPIPAIPLPLSISIQVINWNSFTILQFSAIRIGNKQVEFGELLERDNVKVAVIRESKVSSNYK